VHANVPALHDAPYPVEERNVAMCRAIGRPRRVLDVGCGIGQNGAVARARGAHVVGIDRSSASLARAAARLNEIVAADIEDEASVASALNGRTFDLVLLGDVLEHTRDPLAVLARLMPYVEEEGRVVVSLPNIAAWTVRANLLRGRFDYEPSGILDRTHLRFFTRRTAAELVRAAGLEVLSVDQNPMLVRAAKAPILHLVRRGVIGESPADPTALAESAPYKAYLALVRPAEDALAAAAPGLLAFQHVVVARKRPRPRRLSLTVGMLTMDEEACVERMIGEIRRHAPDAKILCVDSSRDRTPEIAARLGARVLRQMPPCGHGPAMELLLYEAAKQSEALVYLDCDFTYPPETIPRLRALLEDEAVDVVNCARTRSRPAAMPLPNYVANRTFAAMAHALSGVPTADVHSGMRAYRSSVIRAFDFDGEGDALPIDTLLWPAKCGYRVVEIPTRYDERVGASKLRKLAGTAWTFVRLARSVGVGARGGSAFEVR
jgi:2-polyprenyl-3-methyl-5-hydroxy-6-metoxy-1,4-benzoquinol methylase